MLSFGGCGPEFYSWCHTKVYTTLSWDVGIFFSICLSCGICQINTRQHFFSFSECQQYNVNNCSLSVFVFPSVGAKHLSMTVALHFQEKLFIFLKLSILLTRLGQRTISFSAKIHLDLRPVLSDDYFLLSG